MFLVRRPPCCGRVKLWDVVLHIDVVMLNKFFRLSVVVILVDVDVGSVIVMVTVRVMVLMVMVVFRVMVVLNVRMRVIVSCKTRVIMQAFYTRREKP